MATYLVTSKSNSSFGTIAKATGVKMTTKTVGKNSSFCFSLKNNLYAVVQRGTSAKFWSFYFCMLLNRFLRFFSSAWMKIYCYWPSFRISFISFSAFRNFCTLDFCIFNLLRRPTWFVYVKLIYSLRSTVFWSVIQPLLWYEQPEQLCF